jgi:hypothetical protein
VTRHRKLIDAAYLLLVVVLVAWVALMAFGVHLGWPQ